MNPISHLVLSLYVLSAGVTLLIALQSALVSRAGHRSSLFLPFAWLSLCVTLDLLSTAWVYASQDVAEAALAFKFQAAAISLWQLPFYFFVTRLTGKTPRPVFYVPLLLVLGGMFVINWAMPYGLRFSSLERVADLALPWGESLARFGGMQSLAFKVFRVISLSMFVWALVRAVALYRAGERRTAIYLSASVVLILLAALCGAMIDLLKLQWFYPVGFAFMSLVLLMSLALSQDLRERSRSVQDAARELAIAAVSFEVNEAIMITDLEGKILRVNKAFETVTGYQREEVIGLTPRILKSGVHEPEFYAAMWRSLKAQGEWSGEIWDRHKDGGSYPKELRISEVRDDENGASCYVAMFTDLSHKKKSEQDIYQLEHSDSMTGLPNRRALIEHLNQTLQSSNHSRPHGALILIDLDKFKSLNDTLGHRAGDQMLMEVAHRIRYATGLVDVVARLGGDEFVIIAANVGAEAREALLHATHLAEKVQRTLAEPFLHEGQKHHLSASLGVCLYAEGEADADELMKRVEIAMTQAKESGRNKVRFFDPVIQQSFEQRVRTEAQLRQGIEQQLRLFYQLQVDEHKRPIGAEALIRWQHPERGLVLPGDFISVAEDSDLIIHIGRWVLETACQQLAQWSQQPLTRHLTLAININAKQFSEPDFVEQIRQMVNKYRIDPARLKLELTESLALQDIDWAITKMLSLRMVVGVQLSLDDFGTGFSSLAYLKRLPLNQVKIDQGFVRHITSDQKDAIMVKTIIDLSRNFGFDVIAEGVETEDHFDFLKQCGCRSFQGYLFGRPVPVNLFEQALGQSVGAV